MNWTTSISQITGFVPLAIVIGYAIRRLIYHYSDRKGHPLPPGPVPLPLLGSVLSIDSKAPWLAYTKWGEKYGGIIYVQSLDSDVVILNTFSDAVDFLEKRSQISSDRPAIPTVEPYGHEHNLGFSRYSDRWKLGRRIFHRTFYGDAARVFRGMQLHRAREMIINMIDSPEDYPIHFATFASAVALSAAYDYETRARDDPKVALVDRWLRVSVPALTPERAVLLKVFPFLLHLPDWMPGSWIKREARQCYALGKEVVDSLYDHARDSMESGHTNNSMVSDHVARMKEVEPSNRVEYENALKDAAITAFLGSTETTTSILMAFTLAMVKHPRVWKHAQAEIDALVGNERLPDFEDRESLPYVNAIMLETMRWQPVVPIGVPHATTNSDIYKGFYIPKGATVIANVWAMSRDETRYPNAEAFIPERFLDAQGKLKVDADPAKFIFGFGRRVCAGQYVADASLWCTMATMLTTLDFELAKDANGNDITFEATYTDGIAHRPVEFPCRLTPRGHVNNEFLKGFLTK